MGLQQTMETIEATGEYVAAFRPLCDIAAEMGAARVPAAELRRAFTRDSGELMDYARAIHAPRWLVRDLRERCARAHILAWIAASN